MCSEQHTKPEEGFAINELVYSLIETHPEDISRGREVKMFKTSLNNLEELYTKLNTDKLAKIEKIQEYCNELRQTVEVAAEKRIQEINENKKSLIEQISEYEEDSVELYSLNEELDKQISE